MTEITVLCFETQPSVLPLPVPICVWPKRCVSSPCPRYPMLETLLI